MKTKALLYQETLKWIAGVVLYEVLLALSHFLPSALQSRLGNARQMELAFQTARSATLSASNGLQTARGLGVVFAGQVRAALRTFLGDRWSTRWTQVGFINHTLVVPETTAKVVNLLRAMQTYLTNNPTHQNAAAGLTAQAAGAHVTAIEAAQTALNNAKRDQRTKREGRDEVHTTLVTDLRGSRKEVEAVLPLADPRWLDFIERVPADLRAPEAVSDVVAEPGMPGRVRLSFLPSLRAAWYVVEVSLAAGEPFVDVVTVHDTVADLALTPGATARIRIRARNPAGESGPSPVIEVLVPVAAVA